MGCRDLRNKLNGEHKPIGHVRIIAGQWRGRQLAFPESLALRPSPDRVRETLFNWLMPVICGARCLDLFAGSGAFGFEALSRGAREVVFVDKTPDTVQALKENAQVLNASIGQQAHIHQMEVTHFLEKHPNTGANFDIIFLDPPFRLGLVTPCLVELTKAGYTPTYCYIETERDCPPITVPEGWVLHREIQAGQVWGRLYRSGS